MKTPTTNNISSKLAKSILRSLVILLWMTGTTVGQTITSIADVTVNEGATTSVAIQVTGTATPTVEITSVSQEPQTLQTPNAPQTGKDRDPYPQVADNFISESGVSSTITEYTSTLDIAPFFAAGGMDGSNEMGNAVYTVTVEATDEGSTATETFDITVNAVHQPIAASGITQVEAESFYSQGPSHTGGSLGIGVESENGVVNIGYTHNGDFAEYLIDVAQAGTYEMDIMIAKGGGPILVKLEVNDVEVLDEQNPTGGWTTFVSQKVNICLDAGQQVLKLDWNGGSGFLMNIDYFTLELLGNQPPVLSEIVDLTSIEGDAVTSLFAAASDCENNVFTYSAGATLPPGLSIDGSTGEITGTVGSGASGSSPYSVVLTTTETVSGLSSSGSFTWIVDAVANNPPTLSGVTDVEVAEGGTVTMNIIVNDDLGAASSSIIIYDKSDGGTNGPFLPGTVVPAADYTYVDNGGGSYTLTWNTVAGNGRSYQARVTADDGVNAALIETANIDVAVPVPGNVQGRYVSSPLPWYGDSPGTGFSVAIQTTNAKNIGWIDAGEFVEYLIEFPTTGNFALTLYAAKGNAGPHIVNISEEDGTGGFSPIGFISKNITSGGNKWQTYEPSQTFLNITNSGIQNLRFDFAGAGGINIRDFEILNAYEVVASSGANGSISDEGSTLYAAGDDVTYTITPDAGYELDEILVDGQLQTIAPDYTFTGISADATISVTFKVTTAVTYDIVATAGAGGSISPAGTTTVLEAGSQQYDITADSGYEIADVLVDGVSVGALATYTFSNVNANASIAASFNFVGFYVNVGGPEVTTGGIIFAADNGFTGGTVYPSNANALAGVNFANTTDDDIFRTERYGNTSYAASVPNGDYIVDLYFAEIFLGVNGNNIANAIPGKRIFDASIEGTMVLDNLDLLDPEKGGAFAPATGIIKTFVVNVSDGEINISTSTEVDNAKISALCIRPLAGNSVNIAPVVNSLAAVTITAGQPAIATANGVDSDGISEFEIKITKDDDFVVPEASYSFMQAGDDASLNWATSAADVGSYNAVVLAYDGKDVTSSSFAIDIDANSAPVITLLGDNPLNIEVGGVYADPGATASDAEDGDVTLSIAVGGDVVSTAAVATYNVTYDVADALGLAATTVTRVVNITNPADIVPPVITLLGDNPLQLTIGDTYNEPGATALDDVDNDITSSIVVDNSGVNTAVVGSYSVTYDVSDAANNPATQVVRTVNVSAIPESSCATLAYRVNAGGPTVASANGAFEEDSEASPSQYYNASVANTTFSNTVAITNNTGYPDEIFQSERYLIGDQAWSFPANGTYTVSLLFNENWSGEATNARVFDIVIEGNLVEDDYRPSVAAGAINTAIVETYGNIVVTDGVLNIDLNAVSQNPAIKGFDICFESGPANNAPVVNISSPTDGLAEDQGTSITFMGSVTDTEDDDATITAALEWSSDLDGVIGTGATFDISTLSVGGHIITASVTDAGGLSSLAAVLLNISVTDTPPVLAITSPMDGDVVVRGALTTFIATALDSEDGDIATNISWSTDDPGVSFDPVSATGGSVDISFVRPGNTVVTATITDADNNTEIQTITVDVSSPSVAFVAPVGGVTLNALSVNVELSETSVLFGNAEHFHFYINPADVNNLAVDERISTASAGGATTFTFDENSGALALNGMGNGIVAGANTIVVFVADQFHDQFMNPEAIDIVSFTVVDNTAPVITLVGDDPIELQLGDAYVEPGASASDDFDGDITSSIIIDNSTVDVNTAGTYVATYDISDNAGNPATQVVRTINVTALDGIPEVLFEITPGAAIGASTFGSNDKLQITNNSTGTVKLSKIIIDLSTGVFPDMIFDPTGAGGDATAQCFTPDPAKAATVGLVGFTDNCVDPFSNPRQGGFDAIELDFTDFAPGENFSFSVDIDPNSIQGVLGAGAAGSVSGLELAGATITMVFEDTYSVVANLYEDGSFGGSQVVSPTDLPAPTLSAQGIVTNPSVSFSGARNITVSGNPNAYYSLMQMEGVLHIASGDPPFNVPDETFYANQLVDKAIYNGQLDASGTATISVPMFNTPGSGTIPDGGLNHFIAVQSDIPYAVNTKVGRTSDALILNYDDNPTSAEVTGTIAVTNAATPLQAIDLTVSLYQGLTEVSTQAISTNTAGQFSLTGITPGNYDAWIKSSRTLAILQNVTLNPGANAVDFGSMTSGDFQDDNDVDIIDFSGFANVFLIAPGSPGYNVQGDFNFSGLAPDITDFSMFANNFGGTGASLPGSSSLKVDNNVVALSASPFSLEKQSAEHTNSEMIDFVFSDVEQSVTKNTASYIMYSTSEVDFVDYLFLKEQLRESLEVEEISAGILMIKFNEDISAENLSNGLSLSFRNSNANNDKVQMKIVLKDLILTEKLIKK